MDLNTIMDTYDYGYLIPRDAPEHRKKFRRVNYHTYTFIGNERVRIYVAEHDKSYTSMCAAIVLRKGAAHVIVGEYNRHDYIQYRNYYEFVDYILARFESVNIDVVLYTDWYDYIETLFGKKEKQEQLEHYGYRYYKPSKPLINDYTNDILTEVVGVIKGKLDSPQGVLIKLAIQKDAKYLGDQALINLLFKDDEHKYKTIIKLLKNSNEEDLRNAYKKAKTQKTVRSTQRITFSKPTTEQENSGGGQVEETSSEAKI